MIYEHTTQKRHFVIEWARPNAWGENGEGKWVASCNGAQLVAGGHPAAVLKALLNGDCMPALDGANPATLELPPHLDGWSTAR
ncbi:hypothetical protein [Lichenibacterium ramalinae]|uniref:Uncharacterized protein n=1 Tax=Lichenibacterium ramalinae TaxID=2316527 RepID=A0A4Q2RJP3_9HYPH|nr:hypothetical protein [Lichenibacterium ramalinae]RYB06658.1 hypothetical protein D3272_04825 [Lichenibacterium ramalinae]